MSGKPPSSANAVVNALKARIDELGAQWEAANASCDAELEKGTSEGDAKATEHYSTCMALSTQMSDIHAKIAKLLDEQAARTERFRQNKGGKTRRRKYAGGVMAGKTRRNKTSGGDIVSHLLTIRNQIKLYHWQTKQFARHKATDDLTAALDTSIDAFVESYMGRYGRPTVSGSIKLHNFSESAAKTFVAKETKYLEQELPRKIGKNDTDLLNLRDTILGDLTKVSYLFTLQ
jgi:thiamine kinase-like enzyme